MGKEEEMKLERELHAVAYWFLTVGLQVGAVLAFYVLGVAAGLFAAILTGSAATARPLIENMMLLFLPIYILAAVPVATKGRYGKLSVTNVLITFVIGIIPIVSFIVIPYYIGKGFWMLVTRQEPIFEEITDEIDHRHFLQRY